METVSSTFRSENKLLASVPNPTSTTAQSRSIQEQAR